MNRSLKQILALAVVGLTLGLSATSRAADPQYKALPAIAVGGAGSWDYLSVDEAGRRLYVTHGTKVVVIDIDTSKVIAEAPDTAGVHGWVTAPELKRGFSSNGQENKASIFDLELPPAPATGLPQMKLIQKVTTGNNPDAILYEPKSGEVWTFNGRSNTATAFDAKTGKVIADAIAVPGKPETGVADAAAGRVYLNIEDKNEICVIDMKDHKAVAHWPIAPGTAATGLCMDHDLHRLIIGCSNSMAILMDSETGKVVNTIPVGQGVDAVAYDPGTHMAYVSAGGSGNVTIAKLTADKLTLVQTLATERGARTMTVDPKTHRIFLANAPNRTDPNSFHVIVYGIDEATTKP